MRARILRTYVQHIDAAPDVVFPLLCPVREGDWLDGWADGCELLGSESGYAEKGCVFRTFGHDEPESVWTVSEHDRERGVVEFVRVAQGLTATTLRIAVGAGGDGRSTVAISYAVTPTSDAGEAFAVAHYQEAGFRAAMAWWERSMNHYLRTGTLLRAHAG